MTIQLLTKAYPQSNPEAVQLLTEGPGFNSNEPQKPLPLQTLDVTTEGGNGEVNTYSVEEYNEIGTHPDTQEITE